MSKHEKIDGYISRVTIELIEKAEYKVIYDFTFGGEKSEDSVEFITNNLITISPVGTKVWSDGHATYGPFDYLSDDIDEQVI